MSKEDRETILNLELIVEQWKPDDENDELATIEYNSIKAAVNLIHKLQKENTELLEELNKSYHNFDELQEENKNYKELILVIKGKLNNIQFEVEQSWRKIEKLESKYE